MEQSCCQVDCFASDDCRFADSAVCRDAPVECAMGDAYQLTLQPIMRQHRNFTQFQCHIKLKEPTIMYSVWMYVDVTDHVFSTPKVNVTFYATQIRNISRDIQRLHFLSIEHNTMLNIKDEFILMGRSTNYSTPDQWNFAVFSPKRPSEYKHTERPAVSQLSPTAFVASVQFDSPFAYSTSSWAEQNCASKNVTRFHSLQRHFHFDAQSLDVEVTSEAENRLSPYLYALSSTVGRPYVKILIPANTSVLQWYFTNDSAELITDCSLKAWLHLNTVERIWNITMQGAFSDCPGHMTITVIDRTEAEVLVHSDVLVTCPSIFTVIYLIPNWPPRSRRLNNQKIFEVLIQDPQKSYQIFLTMVHLHQIETPASQSASEVLDSSYASGRPRVHFLMLMLAVTTLICVLSSFLIMCIISVSKVEKVKNESAMRPYQEETEEKSGNKSTFFILKTRSRSQLILIVCYAIYRILYNFVFTFTCIYLITSYYIQPDIEVLLKIAELIRINTTSSFQKARRFDSINLTRDLLNQEIILQDIQRSCIRYTDDIFDSIVEHLYRVSSCNLNNMDQNKTLRSSSDSDFVLTKYRNLQQLFNSKISQFTADYQERINATILKTVTDYLNKLQQNGWWRFSGSLANMKTQLADNGAFNARSELKSFMTVAQLSELFDVQYNVQNFWNRYYQELNGIDSPNLLLTSDVDCQLYHPVQNIKEQLLCPEKSNASRFYSNNSAWKLEKNTSNEDLEKAEAKILSDPVIKVELALVYSIFLFMDIVLLLHRFISLLFKFTLFSNEFREYASNRDKQCLLASIVQNRKNFAKVEMTKDSELLLLRSEELPSRHSNAAVEGRRNEMKIEGSIGIPITDELSTTSSTANGSINNCTEESLLRAKTSRGVPLQSSKATFKNLLMALPTYFAPKILLCVALLSFLVLLQELADCDIDEHLLMFNHSLTLNSPLLIARNGCDPSMIGVPLCNCFRIPSSIKARNGDVSKTSSCDDFDATSLTLNFGMMSLLREVQGLKDYANLERLNLKKIYAREFCAFIKDSNDTSQNFTSSNATTNNSSSTSRYDLFQLPMLPCVFHQPCWKFNHSEKCGTHDALFKEPTLSHFSKLLSQFFTSIPILLCILTVSVCCWLLLFVWGSTLFIFVKKFRIFPICKMHRVDLETLLTIVDGNGNSSCKKFVLIQNEIYFRNDGNKWHNVRTNFIDSRTVSPSEFSNHLSKSNNVESSCLLGIGFSETKV